MNRLTQTSRASSGRVAGAELALRPEMLVE
jgi:hypothetical protein